MGDKKKYTHICLRCSTEYESGSARRGYCPECRKERQKESNRNYLERKAKGESRSIGSADICEKCGQPYIIKTGSQKLCDSCIEKGIVIRRTKPNTTEYKRDTYDTLNVYLPKGERESLKKFAALHGKSMNEFVIEAITKYRKELEEECLF